jgi:hypothetical protein
VAIGRQQDDLRSPHVLLRTVPIGDYASNSAPSEAFSLTWVLSCIPQTRTAESAGESVKESTC